MANKLFPLDQSGALINWTNVQAPPGPGTTVSGHSKYVITWVENREFDDELKLTTYQRGRSSVTFIWESLRNGIKHEISLAQSFGMLPKTIGMVYSGRFTYVKRGQNYLVEPI